LWRFGTSSRDRFFGFPLLFDDPTSSVGMESHGHFDRSQTYVMTPEESTLVLKNIVLTETNQISINQDDPTSEITVPIAPGTSRIRKRRLSLGSCLPEVFASSVPRESHPSKQTIVFFNEEHYLHHSQVTPSSTTRLSKIAYC
jgi:hypothetical protein